MLSSKLILHIDDNQDEQLLFAEAIRQIDRTVNYRYISNGEEAVQLLKQTIDLIPAIIFLDLNMPRMSGKECLKELRAIQKLEQVPVIIYTTSTDEKDMEDTKSLGATAFMSKHISFSDMKKAISEALKDYLPRSAPNA